MRKGKVVPEKPGNQEVAAKEKSHQPDKKQPSVLQGFGKFAFQPYAGDYGDKQESST